MAINESGIISGESQPASNGEIEAKPMAKWRKRNQWPKAALFNENEWNLSKIEAEEMANKSESKKWNEAVKAKNEMKINISWKAKAKMKEMKRNKPGINKWSRKSGENTAQ